jgi:cytochrome P450
MAATLSPKNFSDPLKFDPERWLGSKEKNPEDILAASQPFSLGSRGCIGIK